ncbi:hypothetical protein BOH78_5153, partial [Pichia kudriavzevii]
WNWGPRSLPSNSSSQISFTNWLKSFVVKYIIYDRMLWLFLRTEFIQTRGWGVEHVDDFNLFDENAKISTLNQLVIASCAVFCIYFGIQTIYDIMMFINVLLLRRYEFGEYLPLCFYSFAFFQFQFFLIVLEEFVQEAYKKFINVHLPKPILFIIGMTWISISEVYLLLLYLDELVKSGFDIRELVIYY